MLGIPIKANKPTKEKIALSYARLLIEMLGNNPFPDSIGFISEGDRMIRQFVKYEWKATKCIHCLMLGHKEQNCRKKYTVRQEWKVEAAAISSYTSCGAATTNGDKRGGWFHNT